MKKMPFEIACERLKNIDDEKSLRKEQLSPYEYKVCLDMLRELAICKQSNTFIEQCANFFKKCGFDVVKSEDGVCYQILSNSMEIK